MWGEREHDLIAEARGGVIGADAIAIDDEELARAVTELAAMNAELHTGDAEPGGRDAWVASLSKLKDEADKLLLEQHRANEERWQRQRRRRRLGVPPPDQIEPHQRKVASSIEGGL